MALQISESDVLRLLGPKEALTAARSAFFALQHGDAQNVPRRRARTPGAMLHSMSAVSASLQLGAAKIYVSSKTGMQSHLLLYDLETTKLRRIIEANTLGQLRTAASAVLAAELCSKNTWEHIGIIGSGFQAQGVARAFHAHPRGEKANFKLFSRTGEHRAALAAELAQAGLSIDNCRSSAEVLENCELLITATNSVTPVFQDEEAKALKMLCALGSNALTRQEIPSKIIARAVCLLTDSCEVAKLEGGNFVSLIESGRIQWNMVQELGSLLSPQAPSIQDGLVVFCSHGLAVQDLFLAAELEKKLL